MRVNGELKVAGIERLASDPTDLWVGREWYNTTEGVAKIYDGTNKRVIFSKRTLSSSCGAFSTTNTTYTDVTNLSVSFTTSGGGAVMCCLVPDGSSSVARVGTTNLSQSTTVSGTVKCLRDSTDIGLQRFKQTAQVESVGSNLTLDLPVGGFVFMDTPSQGTYTYKIQLKEDTGAGTGQEVYVEYAKLLVYEI